MVKSRPTPVKVIERLRRLRDEVDELLDELAAPSAAEDYSSTSLPLGVSRRRFAEVCRTIPNARREGHVWRVAKADWHAARRRQRTPSTAPAAPRSDLDEADAMIDQFQRGRATRSA